MPNDFQPRLGHRFTLRAAPIEQVNFSGVVACEVLDLQPQRILTISWRDAENSNSLDSTVTWSLEPEGQGTRMLLEHKGFDLDDPNQRLAHQIMSGGWRSGVIRQLAAVLDGTIHHTDK